MKVIRWLLSHIILILLIVAVIYGYMFWGNLLGKETPAGKAVAYLSEEFVVVKDFVDAVKEKQARLNNTRSPESSEQSALAESNNTGETAQQKEIAVLESSPTETIVTEKITPRSEPLLVAPQRPETQKMGTQRQEAQQQVFQQPEHQQPATSQAEQQAMDYRFDQLQNRKHSTGAAESGRKNTSALAAGNNNDPELTGKYIDSKTLGELSNDLNNVKEGDAADEVVTNSQAPGLPSDKANNIEGSKKKDSFISAELEKQLDSVDKQGRVLGGLQNNDVAKKDWVTARKSFYQRNYDLSEKSYQKIIANSVDNFDAYGELGNVYFNQGKNKQAASAYYDAAAILVRKGQVSRAKDLMGVLRHLDRSKAEALQKIINSEQS